MCTHGRSKHELGRDTRKTACRVAHVLLANHRMYNECRALRQCLNPSAPRRNHPDCWSARMLPPLFGRMSTRPHPPPAIRIQVALTISGEPLERLATSEGPLYRVSTSGGPLFVNLLLNPKSHANPSGPAARLVAHSVCVAAYACQATASLARAAQPQLASELQSLPSSCGSPIASKCREANAHHAALTLLRVP